MKSKNYREAYSLLKSFTPLKGDCGILCGKACCKGDERTGMLVFPDEGTTLDVIVSEGRRLAVCNASCERCERPLSCRIFPFFPVMINGRVRAIPDYRGINICPIIANLDKIKLSRRFIRRVERVGEMLYSDPDCAEFMNEISEEIFEIIKLNKLIYGEENNA